MKVSAMKGTIMLLLLCCTVVLTGALMGGCAGSDGAAGAAGPAGPAGPAGTGIGTGETCNVCHSATQLADIGVYHPDKLTGALLVDNVVVSSSAAGIPVVSFRVRKGTIQTDGSVGGTLSSYTTLTASQVRTLISDLVPASAAVTATTSTYTGENVNSNLSGTLASDYWETWASERNTTAGAVLDVTGAAAGNYSWTYSTVWGTPTTTLLNAADVDVTVDTGHTQRVYLRISAVTADNLAKGGAGFADFKVPANGASATNLADSQRQMVTVQACWKCHSTTLLAAGHGGGYMDTRACVLCHSPLYAENATTRPLGFMSTYNNGEHYMFPVWIHKIHAAGKNFEEVTYPQDIKKCDVCHTNSGLSLGTGDQTNNWKSHPTRVACGSCHTTALFATGLTFTGLDGVSKTHIVQASDSGCSTCHSGVGAPNSALTRDVVTVHDTTPTGMNVPEYDVTLSLSPPAGAYYISGETVTVTATLATHGTGSAVAGSVYTTAKAAAGTTGGGLSTASLYVYGPRAKALPLLGIQATSLFTGGTDTRVKTDATGFIYRMTIPAGTTSGTYGVRFRAGDYGRVNDTNYKIESTAFTTIQIGTATAEKKIDGDMCKNCHGTGTAPFHDARHSVVFDTDECVSCHDLSGGHADPISNRVHAIHDSSVNGDLLGISWVDVTYPQGSSGPTTTANSTGAKICVGCHTSGNTAYKTNALGVACYGCHGDSTVTVDHMLQNGGPVK